MDEESEVSVRIERPPYEMGLGGRSLFAIDIINFLQSYLIIIFHPKFK